MSDFDKAVAALITPEGQAWADYINGRDGENNPYTEDSDNHRHYSEEMNRLRIYQWLGESK